MSVSESNKYDAIVIGTSAGGLMALLKIVQALPANFPISIIIVQHRLRSGENLLETLLQSSCRLPLKQADEKEKIMHGHVYTAPPGYHLIIEKDQTFSLSCGEENKSSVPSIDVMFETAAEAFGNKLMGIILTGASNDGASGIKSIAEHGGTTVVQDPDTAEFALMPASAIATGLVQKTLTLEKIIELLISLDQKKKVERRSS
jgi:two-component system, chemotaxis family, protein-glutamate methylesterase/glutaminase